MPLPPEPIYRLENVHLFEAIYGKNLISLGGLAAIDNMFSDINLNELKALDIGFGLGGVAFYLAKKYQIEITGIEIHNWMVEYATTHIPKEIDHLLEFIVYDEASKIPLQANSYDLVYSKGVLNHVQDKKDLFLEINRVLKINGLFVIADWIYLQAAANSNSDPLVKETQESYQKILTEAQFADINFRNDSKIFLTYIKALLHKVTLQRQFIEKKFGTEIFSTIVADHQQLIEDINNQRKLAVRIMTRKKRKS